MESLNINISNLYVGKTLVDIFFRRINPMVIGNKNVNAIEINKPTGNLFYIDF
ncbi:MAG: hypothetical protein VZR33_01555 [Methanosphaera sp.]|nr:hypothetical protein [Methanosphaera sp.]